jgi:hypothetical protein
LYHRRSWKVFLILFTHGKGRFWRLKDLIAQHSEAQTGCPVTFTYTRREVRELLERYGYWVTELRIEHIFPYRIADYLQYRHVQVWYFRWMPQSLFRWLERRFGWHVCVTARRP